MKRFNEFIKQLSLTQQLFALIFFFVTFFAVFFFVYVNGSVNNAIKEQIFKSLDDTGIQPVNFERHRHTLENAIHRKIGDIALVCRSGTYTGTGNTTGHNLLQCIWQHLIFFRVDIHLTFHVPKVLYRENCHSCKQLSLY